MALKVRESPGRRSGSTGGESRRGEGEGRGGSGDGDGGTDFSSGRSEGFLEDAIAQFGNRTGDEVSIEKR